MLLRHANIMKRHALRLLFLAGRLVMRHAPGRRLRGFVFHAICRRYINWRDLRCTARTQDGSVLDCLVSDLTPQRVIYFRVWEPNLTDFVRRTLRPGDVFVDVGANIGYFSLLAARLVGPAGGVVAIEASPAMTRVLSGNIARNRATNVRIANVAATERVGMVSLYAGAVGNAGTASILAGRGPAKEADVPCAPLSTILRRAEAAAVRLIKIDIEGSEAPVLRDILANLDHFPATVEIVTELSPADLGRFGWSAEGVIAAFAAAGFAAYLLANDYSDDAYVRRAPIAPPVPLTGIPAGQVDLVFSRRRVPQL